MRPDLQGLRAIAVLLVLGYHLWPGAIGGGFVGVDVFFVLSGFLITGDLIAEAESTGGIAIRAFWARRVRRLLPAASVVLVASFALMLLVLPQSLWQRTVTEIGASALYVQNWLLLGNAADYLGAENQPTVVQHYWSLSVEEQFYLLWPILVALTFSLRPTRAAIAGVLASVALASLIVSGFGSPADYFNTAARAWEFAAGGLLALSAPVIMRPRLAVAAGWLGLALVVGSALAYSGKTPFPGVAALVPVLGTVLVIAVGQSDARWAIGRLISMRAFRFVGDHSYGIYLWHWPLVIVAPYLIGGQPGAAGGILVLIASIALAVLTTRLVERPVGRGPLLARPRRAFATAAVVATLLVAASTVSVVSLAATSAAAERQSVIDVGTKPCYGASAMVEESCGTPHAVPDTAVSAFAPVDKGSLGQPCDSSGVEIVECEFGDLVDPAHTVTLIGNSHAGHLVAAFERYGQEHGWRIILLRKTGCTGASVAVPTAENDRECAEWTRAVLDRVHGDEAIDTVVFATNDRSQTYLAPDGASAGELSEVRTSIADTLDSLVDAGRTVVTVGDVPGTPQPAPECVDRHHLEYDPCASPASRGQEEGNLVAEVGRSIPGVGFVSLTPYLCDESLCHVVVGGVVVYIDEHHLSASFSRSLAPYLGAAVQARMDIGR